MKNTKRLLLGGIACLLLSCLFSSCQQTQTASAQKRVAGVGDTPEAYARALVDADVEKKIADAPPAPSTDRNQFGFGGADRPPVKPLKRETVAYTKPKIKEVKKEIPKPKVQKKIQAPKPPVINKPIAPPPVAPSINSTSAIVKLDYADRIPGDNLHVTLPGDFASLGRISIERMDPAGNTLGTPWARGTQMQIPNPNVTGGKIYFKVP